MDERFWPYFIRQAALVQNVLVDDECVSPYFRVFGKQFDYNVLHAMGCLCYYLLPNRDRASKLSPRALPAQYLGYDHERLGSFTYVPSIQRLTSAYHLVFNEHRNYDSSLDTNRVRFRDQVDPDSSEPIGKSQRVYREDSDDGLIPLRAELPHPADDPQHSTADTEDGPGYWNEDHCSNTRCTFPKGHDGPCSDDDSRWTRFRPRVRRNYSETQQGSSVYAACEVGGCTFHADHCGECYDEDEQEIVTDFDAKCFVASPSNECDDWDSVMDFNPLAQSVFIDDVQHEVLKVDASAMSDVPCPKQYEDARKSPLWERWLKSMQDEITALISNGTWKYVSRNDPRLRKRKPTKSRWVYTIKYNRDGTISRFKSRFVVCGYSQRQGIDYDRAFSATLRGTTFRTLLAVAAGKKLRLMQIDISNAFTQADMDDVDVFVEPAKGFEVWEIIDGKRVSKLLHLRRALYGTKQASRLWQQALRKFLVDE